MNKILLAFTDTRCLIVYKSLAPTVKQPNFSRKGSFRFNVGQRLNWVIPREIKMRSRVLVSAVFQQAGS